MRHAWTLLLSLILCAGCHKQSVSLDQGWTTPTVVTSSIDSLASGTDLHKTLSKAIALQWQDTSEKSFILARNEGGGNSWKEVSSQGIPQGYSIPPTVDQSGGRIVFPKDHTASNQMTISILFARLNENGAIQIETERKWMKDKQSFFGATGTNVSLNMAGFGTGSMNDGEIYLPYCLYGTTLTLDGRVDGPFNSGVFHSSDSGATWQVEQVESNFELLGPMVCKTEGYYYYFAIKYPVYELWFSRKSTGSGSWDAPMLATKTFAKELGNYIAATDGDTVHVCWMDRRHNKWRFDLSGPAIENDDIYYSHRKDSDSGWRKDVNLSKGVLYCYAPSISAEGNNVVVAWAGIQNAGKYHTDYDPNDIYYVTSKDGGNTWSKPLKVPDGAKDGMTAGHPQVMLLNGVIHLFYIQGKMDLQQVGGLTKLNQPPWPIYYTQRPFPN
jgi:hypothetical protein